MALYRINMNITPLIYNTYYKFCFNMNKLDFPKGQSTIKNRQFPLKYMSTQSKQMNITYDLLYGLDNK